MTMNQQGNPTENEIVLVGTGEFQLRDVYVVATVRVQDGIVKKIDFTSTDGIQVGDTTQTAEQLEGKPLLEALEVKAREVDSYEDHRGENVAKVALLEAFHRAVEACFDNE